MKTLLRNLAVLLCSTILAATACAQMSGPPPAPNIQSLNVMAANSKAIIVGDFVSAEPANQYERGVQQVTVKVKDVLKGAATGNVKVTLWFAPQTFERWRRSRAKLLVAIPQDPKKQGYAVELSAPNPFAFDEDMTVYRKPEDILATLKRLIKRYEGSQPVPVSDTNGPFDEAQKSVLATEYVGHFVAKVEVPTDSRLEARAVHVLRQPGKANAPGPKALRMSRQEAIGFLRAFKSAANIRLLKGLLNDPEYGMGQQPSDNKGIETRYYMIRSSAWSALADWGVKVKQPVVEETVNVIGTIDHLFVYQPKPNDSFDWMLYAKQLKSLQLYESGNLTNLQIHDITQLDSLTDLKISRSGITDANLTRFLLLPNIERLELNENPLTDACIPTLAKFPHLKEVSLANTQITAHGYSELRQAHPYINISPAQPTSPASYFAELGDLTFLRQVIERLPSQLNAHDPNREGNTPLHVAAMKGNYDVVKYLLEKGADIEAVNNNGQTPLWLAIRGSWGNRDNVIHLLLSHGADINHPDNNGDTPLHAAIDDSLGDYGGNTRFLITTGADPFLKDKAGKLPLDFIHNPTGPEIDRLQALVKLMEEPVPLIPQTNAECDYLVYQTKADDLTRWSSTPTGRLTGPLAWSKAPLSDQHYLGPFGQQAVALTLANLPDHKNVRVEIELWVLGSWDGNGGLGPGPDIIDISIPEVGTAMHSTFFNNNEGDAAGLREQSFPDPYPLGHHLAYTGAVLAHQLPFKAKRTAAYKLSYTFAHTGSGLEVVITGMNVVDDGAKKLLDDEHWGIASVTVKTD